MSRFVSEIFESSIIVAGNFNPAIFSPYWMEKNNLIGPDDAKNALKSPSLIITNQVLRFETEWFVLQVLPQQFSLTSKGAIAPMMRDLAEQVFLLLPHTPVTAVGLNFQGHYKINTIEDYHKIGDALAPKEIWNQIRFFPEQSSGLEHLTIRIDPFKRKNFFSIGSNENFRKVIFQPSTEVIPGIFLALNDHRNVPESNDNDLTKAENISKIIKDEWNRVKSEAEDIFKQLLERSLSS